MDTKLPSISLIEVDNDHYDDDDEEDLKYKYIRDKCFSSFSHEYVRNICDDKDALLYYQKFCEWHITEWEDTKLFDRTEIYLELLSDGMIRPAPIRLRSSPVQAAMDCLSCLDRKTFPDRELPHSKIRRLNLDKSALDVSAKPHDYYLYAVAGCPFSARPWCALAFYGLTDVVRVQTLFPAATSDREWFFHPESWEEDKLAKRWTPERKSDADEKCVSLRKLYMTFDEDYVGHASVPILGSTRSSILSNRSLPIARWLANKWRVRATQHADVNLFPCPKEESDTYVAHEALLQELHDEVTTAVYKIHALKKRDPSNRTAWEGRVNAYLQKLGELQTRISTQGPYLFGETIRFADFMLFISLVRLDLVYCDWLNENGSRQEEFVRKTYPILWDYLIRILILPGIEQTVFPGDIMALYFLTPQFAPDNVKTVPSIPDIWKELLRSKRTIPSESQLGAKKRRRRRG